MRASLPRLAVWGVILAALLAACTSPRTPTDAPPQATQIPSTVPPTATPIPRQELVICAPYLPPALATSGDVLAEALRRLVVPQAAVFGTDYTAEVGDLLAALPTVEDGSLRRNADGTLTVRLRYRDDLVWSDGEPFDADDALLGLRLPPLPYAPAFEVLEARRVDDWTLEVTAAPGAEYPYVPSQPPLPMHWLGAEADLTALGDERLWSVTLGPYRLAASDAEGWGFEANPHYPHTERLIPRVTVRPLPAAEQIAAALAAGNCDLALDGSLSFSQLAALQEDEAAERLRLYMWAGAVTEEVVFNTYPPASERIPFFADGRVRQAVALAFDRAALPQALWGVPLPVLESWLPADHWAAASDGLTHYPYDAAAARTLLEEAGWRDDDGDGIREYHGAGGTYGCERGEWAIAEGTPFTPTLIIPAGDALRARIAAQLTGDLAQVGVQVIVQEVAPEVLFSREGPLVRRQFDMALLAAVTRPDPDGISRWVGADVFRHPLTGALVHRWELEARFLTPEQMVERVAYANIPAPENDYQGQNYAGWCNAEADLAIVEAALALNLEEKRAAYARHAAIFMAELPVLPLFARPRLAASAPYVCGIVPNPYEPLTWNITAWWFDESGTCAP